MLICIGDGRYVDHKEGELSAPPPIKRVLQPGAPIWKKKGHKLGEFDAVGNPRGTSTAVKRWGSRRGNEVNALLTTVNNKPVARRPGLTRKYAQDVWRISRKKAKEDMENIKKTVDLTAAAEEALEKSLEVMRGPLDAKTRIAAARLVLDFTMPKPTSKSEVTVKSAEDWLESLSDDKQG